jgi:hypothetical protein
VTAAECLTTLIVDYRILQIVLLKALYVLLTRRGPRLALTLGRAAALAIAAVSASRGNERPLMGSPGSAAVMVIWTVVTLIETSTMTGSRPLAPQNCKHVVSSPEGRGAARPLGLAFGTVGLRPVMHVIIRFPVSRKRD